MISTDPLEHDPHQLRELAEDLLTRPPYTESQPGLFERLFRFLGDAFSELLGRLLSAAGGSPAIAWIIAVVGLLALGAVVFVATRRLTSGRGVSSVAVPTRGRSAADWHADADTAAEAGDLLAALRYRYIAIVATLVEQGVLEHQPGRTVRELDRQVQVAAPSLADHVTQAGERLEDAVYGDEEVTPADVEVVDAAAQAVAEAITDADRQRVGSSP